MIDRAYGRTCLLKLPLDWLLLIRGPFAYLEHGWKGCSKQFPFPQQFNLDFGEPLELCKETAPKSNVWTREWTKASVSMDCNTWTPTIKLK